MIDHKDDEMTMEQRIRIELDAVTMVQSALQRCILEGRDPAPFERLYELSRTRYFNLLVEAGMIKKVG